MTDFIYLSLVHLNEQGKFPERVVRFWIAELATGLAYLHKQHIVHRSVPALLCCLPLFNIWPHRDIKPDNILLDVAGHAHLTDFNVAIHYSDRRLHTSVAGSMAYMAPEIVNPSRKGYTWHIDWWSLGVCAYELLWHKRPFDGNTAEKMRDSILRDPIIVPPALRDAQSISPEGRHAILGVSVLCDRCIWSRGILNPLCPSVPR